MTKRLIALVTVVTLTMSGCSLFGGGASDGRILHARFSRAIQVFPGNTVRILGVDVGRVITVQNVADSVDVTFRIDDPTVSLPANVKATIVPVSLLGERYIQLFPSYNGGPKFSGTTIGLSSTSVPAEQDELLRSLQNYFGALDPKKVATFVTNAAKILEHNGRNLNKLIDKGSGAIAVLAGKRDSIAGLIQEFNTLTTSLATRQGKIASVINSYNAVTKTLNQNRNALEGTITGLNQAATELASLLIEHQHPLGSDLKTLTRTMRTLSRNAGRFTKTAHWAKRLFFTAYRAGDRKRHWLRLGDQGEPILQLLAQRLQDRLAGVCRRLKVKQCVGAAYWQKALPDLFCTVPGSCTRSDMQTSPGRKLKDTLTGLPGKVGKKITKGLGLTDCKTAAHPRRCRRRNKKKHKQQGTGGNLNHILHNILKEIPNPVASPLEVPGGVPGL